MSKDEIVAIEPRLAERINEFSAANRRLTIENEAFSRIGQILSSSADIEEIYERFSEQLRILIPFDRMAINLINTEDDVFSIEYVTGLDVGSRNTGSTFPAKRSASGKVALLRTGMTIHADHAGDVDKTFPTLIPYIEAGLRSFLYVPMITRDQFVGVICLSACMSGFYTDDHLELVERVSSPIAGAISIARLYEERNLLTEQLNQAQKMEAIGRLAGGVAHDFNNLLTPIIGYAQFGMKSASTSDETVRQFQKIYEAADRASKLVKQLLTFSRKEIIRPKAISLSNVIAGMDSILRRLIDENIEFISRPKSDLRLAKMDKGQMEQVLVNLVVNARDAMPNGGRIIIETDDVDIREGSNVRHPSVPPGKYVRMSVCDNGMGMTDDIKNRIYDPFFTTKEVGEGTGLGLSVCYGIVKQIDGHIFVDSQPRQGTTFTIYVPSVEDEYEESSDYVQDAGQLPDGTETILLVEDELAVREIAAFVLREQGYTVLEAASGAEALQIFNESRRSEIHLLLTDVVLPGLDGRGLSDQITQLSPETKVLYFSGYAEDTIGKYGILEETSIFLQKPFYPEQLIKAVQSALQSGQALPSAT
jgi:signal transduction histidine kinase/CheY-like chemotaxis protein